MSALLIQILFMSMRAVLIIGVVFGIRKLFALAHIPQKYVMPLWLIPFFFLVFPWRITVRTGFWIDIPKLAAGGGELAASDEEAIDEVEHNISDTVLQLAGWPQRLEWTESPNRWESGKLQLEQEQTQAGDQQNSQAISVEAGAEDMSKDADVRKAFRAGWENMLLDLKADVQTAAGVLSVIWAVGMFVFVLYAAVSYIRLKRNLLCSVRREDSSDESGTKYAVYDTDGIQTPMVFGFFQPCIYLPAGIDPVYESYVIAHEHMHIRRKDYLIKAGSYLITCLHWFNPAVWTAWYLMSKDMEMACDEETISRMGMEQRKEYASVLLELSVGRRSWFAVPPAFGEGDIRTRIQNIMVMKNKTKKAAVLAISVTILIMGVFLISGEKGAVQPAASVSTDISDPKRASQSTQKPDPAQKVLTFQMVRKAFAQHTVNEINFHEYTNGSREDFAYDDALNYLINFTFVYENERYKMQTSYEKNSDQLMDINILRLSDGEMRWIYTVNDEKEEIYPNDLQSFLDIKIAVADWLTLELPEGYSIGSYQGGIGYCGGALILPKVWQPKIQDSFAPIHWTYAGWIGKVAAPGDIFVFENGKLQTDRFPHANHSVELPVGIVDTSSAGSGWTTLMVHGWHDLYTAADLGELEEAGEDLRSLETQSEYWYFYFVKEGDPNAYVLSLSAKDFTKEKASEIAATVKITEDEAALQRKKNVQRTLDRYLQDFLQTMRADSRKVYQRDAFTGMDGYLAAKWLESQRELYKKEYGGIRSVHAGATELLHLKEKGDNLEVLARTGYTYTWGDGSQDTAHASNLFWITLEPEGSGWRVMDLAIRDCAEIITLEELLEQEWTKIGTPDKYQLVEKYFRQIYEKNL